METLPYLALKEIVQQLRPADLARCSAVCRDWRDTFNQDWMWKPHCDPELEEPLRTIPSVATPAFVTPEEANSTLSSIGRWKLAYMRENHLLDNWKSNSILQEGENAIEIENVTNDIFDLKFLVDTLIVVWRNHKIEIFDVSEKLHVCKAQSDASFTIGEDDICRAIGASMLLVDKNGSVEVYSVSLADQLIRLKHRIVFSEYCDLGKCEYIPYGKCHVKDHLYFLADDQRSVLLVFDLNTGELLQEFPYPMMVGVNERINVFEIKGFSTSDFVAIIFSILDVHSIETQAYVFVYSVERLTLLSDVVIDLTYAGSLGGIVLHHHWLAYTVSESLTVYNVQTKNELLCLKEKECIYTELHLWNNCFVFIEMMFVSKTLGMFREKTSLKKYSPDKRTLTTMLEFKCPDDVFIGKIINQKYMMVVCFKDRVQTRYLCRQSGETMTQMKCDDAVDVLRDSRLLNCSVEVNQSFSRAIFSRMIYLGYKHYVQYLW